MTTASIMFRELIQDTQSYNSFNASDDHMVPKIVFDLEVGGTVHKDMLVEVRQPFGTNYESEPLEVARPQGSYDGPWNHTDFADLCEGYYRSLIGSAGSGIRIGRNASNIRMRNNHYELVEHKQLSIPEEGSAGW